MPSLREQMNAKFANTLKNNPEFAKRVDDLLSSADTFQAGAKAVEVGRRAPDFELPDAQGETVLLSELLVRGPVVVTFYRGSWCPYCSLQTQAMLQRLTDIHAMGAELVAITPEIPDGSLTSVERKALAFPVLSDQGAGVAAEYGVAWEVPAMILDHIRNDRKLDLADINGGNGSVLPIPATFVVSQSGVVTWRFVNVDYQQRAEPDDIIDALQELT